jgi:hypothetical protein
MHAIYIDGVLIPAKHLVNARSITQCAPEGANIIEYLHIELSSHDVIFAEGVAAETFGGQGRENFDNFVEFYRRYPNDAKLTHPPYAPLYGDLRLPQLFQALRIKSLRPLADPLIRTLARERIRDRIAQRAKELVE